jgi:anti-anti-sigma regulatory factor
MKKLSQKQKEHFARRSLYQFKRTNSSRVWTDDPVLRRIRNNKPKLSTLEAPENFNLQYENCENVIRYINKIKKASKKGFNIVVDLKNVKDIREGAIAMLLSVMKEVEKRKIHITGSLPNSADARKVLEQSGFFKFVITSNKMKPDSIKTKNIMKTGVKGTSPVFLGDEIKKAMGTVWGEEGRNPLLHTVAFEMMRNSCDHAFENNKKIRWHFSISHDESSNLTKFSFVDNGIGIIKTLKEHKFKKILRYFTGNTDILETAFTDGIESRTGLPWRGKGLPTIFENYEERYIKTLLIITNGVFIDFDRKIKKELPVSFAGTYYYWEVDTTCVKACFN